MHEIVDRDEAIVRRVCHAMKPLRSTKKMMSRLK